LSAIQVSNISTAVVSPRNITARSQSVGPQEGIPNFDDPYKHHHDPLGLPQYQLPLSTIQVSNISTAVVSPRNITARSQSVGLMHPIFRGPYQFHHPSLPSFDWQLRSPHTPTESRSTVSSSSHRSVSIASGSVPSLGRLKQPRARRGSKKGSSKLDMSNLGSYPPEVQEILRIAKLSFVIESFAAGLFWAHQKSRLRSAYDEKVLEALAQGNALAAQPGKSRFLYIPKSLILRHRYRFPVDSR